MFEAVDNSAGERRGRGDGKGGGPHFGEGAGHPGPPIRPARPQSKPRLSLRSSPASRFCSAAGRPSRSSDSASTSRVIAASTRVRPAGLISTRMPRPSLGSVWRVDEPALDEPVDAVRHGAARDERLLQQLLGGEAGMAWPARRSAESTSNSDASSSERANACSTGAVEVLREARDPGEHLQRREVEVGPLALPVASRSGRPRQHPSCRHYPAAARRGMPQDATDAAGPDRPPWQT